MTPLTKALTALYPGLNFADVDGTLKNVRWDAPLPDKFTPPTQKQVDAQIAVQDAPPTPTQKLAAIGLTPADLKALLA